MQIKMSRFSKSDKSNLGRLQMFYFIEDMRLEGVNHNWLGNIDWNIII